jgi:hypothetical protein
MAVQVDIDAVAVVSVIVPIVVGVAREGIGKMVERMMGVVGASNICPLTLQQTAFS